MTLATTFTVTQPSDTEVTLTREFDAPARLVWDAYTKPEYVRQWLLGPDGWDMPVCDIDLRVGGRFQYRWSHPTEGSFGTEGEFTEVTPHLPHREHRAHGGLRRRVHRHHHLRGGPRPHHDDDDHALPEQGSP